jgi:tripartite ATP-independent transporter DctP family solute receptor
MRTIVAVIALLTLLAAAPPARAEDKPAPLFLAHLNKNDAADNPTGAMAVTFKQEFEKRAGAKVEIFPEGQLGHDAQMLDLVRKGVIQSAIVSLAGIRPIYPLIEVVTFPFAYRAIEDTYAVYDGPFAAHLATDIEAKTGLAVMGFGDNGGMFELTNSKRPVRSPADVAGLRIRVMDLKSHAAFIRSLGAEPVTISWKETFGALQSGVADGQMNSVSIVRAGRLEEVQQHLSLTNHLFIPFVWVANRQYLDGLDADRRQAALDAARAAVVASRTASRAIEARGLPYLQDRMQITRPTDQDIEAFRQLAQPAMAAHVAETHGPEGTALLDAFLAAVAEARKAK